MRKTMYKRLISSILASSIIVASYSAINTFAMTGVYADLDILDESIEVCGVTIPEWYAEVTINMNGIYNVDTVMFNVEIGDGWEFVMEENSTVYPVFEQPNPYGGSDAKKCIFECVKGQDGEANFFHSGTMVYPDMKYSLVKMYLKPVGNQTPTNSVVNITYDTNEGFKGNGSLVYGPAQTPSMLKAYEYVIGDTDGDGIVNASDTSNIMRAVENYGGGLLVSSINNNYTNWFANADCAAAPDANKNGTIDNTDANLVQSYYVNVSTGSAYNGIIGTIDVHEIYD